MGKPPTISIIITAFSAARITDIYELMDSIKTQSYQNIDVVFVAERSLELSEKIKNYCLDKNISNVQVLFSPDKLGLSAARNMGIATAKGDILGFVDDDCVLFPEWANEVVNAFQDESVIGVTGPALPLWEDKSMSWFPEEFYWILSCTAWYKNDKKTEVRNAWGMNMSFRKEAFDKAGLFTPDFGLHDANRTSKVDPPSEDVDLSLRVKSKTGKSIIYCPTATVYHRVYTSRLKSDFIRRRSYSVGYQRRMLRVLYKKQEAGNDVLAQEHQLLKRILTRLLPDIIKTFFLHPAIACRKISVTFNVLANVALGYYSHQSVKEGVNKSG